MPTLPREAIQRLRRRLEAVMLRGSGDVLAIRSEREARGRLQIIANDMIRELERWKADEDARLWSAAREQENNPNDDEAA